VLARDGHCDQPRTTELKRPEVLGWWSYPHFGVNRPMLPTAGRLRPDAPLLGMHARASEILAVWADRYLTSQDKGARQCVTDRATGASRPWMQSGWLAKWTGHLVRIISRGDQAGPRFGSFELGCPFAAS